MKTENAWQNAASLGIGELGEEQQSVTISRSTVRPYPKTEPRKLTRKKVKNLVKLEF